MSAAPRYLQEERPKPFTVTSLNPEGLISALDTARQEVAEYVAEELKEVFEPLQGEITTLIEDISPDSIKEIRTKLIDCFEGLDDENLERLETITSFLTDFNPDAAVEKLLSPDEEGSCSPLT